MNRKILFLVITIGFLSCSKYSGPDYNVPSPDNKQNGGGYDEATYNEDISMFSMRLDHQFHGGTEKHKATKQIVNGKTLVVFTYEFKRGDSNFIFYLTIPDYQGEDIYGRDSTKPAGITFHKRKNYPAKPLDSVWNGNQTTMIPDISKGVNIEVTHADEKYIDAKFDGNFIITDGANAPIGTSNVAAGVIRAQWQR